MESRWLLLAFGVLSAALTVAFVRQGDAALAAVGVVQTVFGLGGFWWNTTRETNIETRFSRSR
jgi:hypothetical protein